MRLKSKESLTFKHDIIVEGNMIVEGSLVVKGKTIFTKEEERIVYKDTVIKSKWDLVKLLFK